MPYRLAPMKRLPTAMALVRIASSCLATHCTEPLSEAGPYGIGTVFRVNTDGSHFTNLFSFNNGPFIPTNSTYPESMGDMPNLGLLLISNTLYGTTFYGGLNFAGTVFKIDTDGSNFSQIHAFDFTDGQGPASGLTLYGNTLYGTTVGGGNETYGTIFSVSLSGLGFSSVYNFQTQINPYGGVVVSSNTFYGFGQYGGPSLDGVVYRLGTDGTGYSEILDFSGNQWLWFLCHPDSRRQYLVWGDLSRRHQWFRKYLPDQYERFAIHQSLRFHTAERREYRRGLSL